MGIFKRIKSVKERVKGELGRRTAASIGSYIPKAAGIAGAAGVAGGDGQGYLDKLYDGITATPNFIYNAYNTWNHLRQLSEIGKGVEQIQEGIGPAAQYLNNPQFLNAWEMYRKSDSVFSQLWDWNFSGALENLKNTGYVLKELHDASQQVDMNQLSEGIDHTSKILQEIDANAIITYFSNMYDNFTEQPIETAAVMAAIAGLGYYLGKKVVFWGHRGEGGFTDMYHEEKGWDRYPNYHTKKAIKNLTKRGYRVVKEGEVINKSEVDAKEYRHLPSGFSISMPEGQEYIEAKPRGNVPKKEFAYRKVKLERK